MGNFLLSLGIACCIVLVPSSPCPASCRCITHSAHPSADCSYRELQFVPLNLPSNLTQLSLSANNISALNTTSFYNILGVTSLWLAYNQITNIEKGTFRQLVRLTNLDLSHNRLIDFPWNDLSKLQNLHVLNLNNNQLVTVPKGTFKNSQKLRSFQISSNKISDIFEETFDPLISLSHLQIHSNLFNCTCSLEWLKGWLVRTSVTIDKRSEIFCSYPKHLKGVLINQIPDMKCRRPLDLQAFNTLMSKELLICHRFGNNNLMIQMDTKASKNFMKEEITNKGKMSPIRHSVSYLCSFLNNTERNQNDMSIFLANYSGSEWVQKKGEKFLLVMVPDTSSSEVNKAPLSLASYILYLFPQIMVWELVLQYH
ncbi:immunoglobulin superfamily containing leucine-rich repeat protein [Bombina bombina]|uniref:immunoglobulin superfamily containing leucine-rich repeat protein n=1 Tax=Bombina bombina TaxID=8345 RepID=UPI00235A96D7|nr:immunoglobulin superfamily containing leucine-rich repeat protein [Bombina bombina]